jgi:cell division protein FtsN
MKKQRGYSAFPTVFLTFSLLLLVLAAGFAVGRLVVGRAYIKSAGQFEKLPVPKGEAGDAGTAEGDQATGQGYVPAPEGQNGDTQDQSQPQAEIPDEQTSETPDSGTPSDLTPPADEQPPADAPPAETPKPAEDRAKRYAIQIGMFESDEGAQQVADDLARAGYPARVEVAQNEGAKVYRVLTGRYRTEYAARKAMDQLRQEGFLGFLVER